MEQEKECVRLEDCCMTAIANSGVYMVAKPKKDALRMKVSGERIAEAVRHTVTYRKKKV